MALAKGRWAIWLARSLTNLRGDCVYPFTGLRLLLPAIIPSWRFFDAVAASPRVDYAITAPDTQPRLGRICPPPRPRDAGRHGAAHGVERASGTKRSIWSA
jgi:hypothetical protein